MKLLIYKYGVIKVIIVIIVTACFLSSHSFTALAQEEVEGRRGRLKIDYKSKIDFVAEGRKYLNKGDVKEALYNATYAVANDFDRYDSYLLLADIYRASKELVSEAYALEYTINHAPNERLKKEAAARLKSVRAAIKNLGVQKSAAAVVKNPQSVNRVLRLGHTFERFGAPDKAAAHYEYADNITGEIKSAKYAKIRLYLKEGKKKKADGEIKNYFALIPDDTSMVYLLAYHGFNLSEIKQHGYNGGGGLEMRRYNRTYADYYYEIGYQQYLNEKYDQAKISILYSLSYFKTSPKGHIALGEIFYKKGMFKEAAFHYNINYEFNPGDYEVGLKMAKSMVMSKQYERARTALKELLKINPESDEYAHWLIKTGLTRRAVEDMGYIDVKSPFYKKKRPANKAPATLQIPGGPENLLRQPPAGPNSPFYQNPQQPIQIQL
jgi:Tfp pilus assembly protein PilF